jgi:inhibitor of cysteine peptidase
MEIQRSMRVGALWVGALAAVVVLAAVSLAACGGAAGNAPASPSPTPAVYTAVDSGATVAVTVGERFTVSLKENPTTGYAWDMKAGPGLTLVGDAFAGPSPSPSPLMGAGGMHSWVFEAAKAGTLTLTGLYVRPWEPQGKSAADFSLTIESSEKK